MRVVIMDEDMREPITVVELPANLMREVEQRRLKHIVVPVPLTFSSWFSRLPAIPECSTAINKVCLRIEPIHNGRDVLYWVAVPDDPELALLLRAAFLPGQRTELRRRETQAWFHGAVAAIR